MVNKPKKQELEPWPEDGFIWSFLGNLYGLVYIIFIFGMAAAGLSIILKGFL